MTDPLHHLRQLLVLGSEVDIRAQLARCVLKRDDAAQRGSASVADFWAETAALLSDGLAERERLARLVDEAMNPFQLAPGDSTQ